MKFVTAIADGLDDVTVRLLFPGTALVTVMTFAAGLGAENPAREFMPTTPPEPIAILSATPLLDPSPVENFKEVAVSPVGGSSAVAVRVISVPALSLNVIVSPATIAEALETVMVQVA